MKIFNIIAVLHVGSVIQIRFKGSEEMAYQLSLMYQMSMKDAILSSSVMTVRSEAIHGIPNYNFEAFEQGGDFMVNVYGKSNFAFGLNCVNFV